MFLSWLLVPLRERLMDSLSAFELSADAPYKLTLGTRLLALLMQTFRKFSLF